MGTVPTTDEGYVKWVAYQSKAITKNGTSYCMKLYTNNLNFQSQITYVQQLKEYKEKLQSMEGTEQTPAEEPISDIAVEGDKDHNMNTPIPQNISSPIPLNIPILQSQEHLSTPSSEHLSQNSPNFPPMPQVPPNTPGAEQNLNVNSITMSQALELFELMQAKRAGDGVRLATVEAQHVEAEAPRAEPLSFLTLETVEGIVRSMDLGNLEEQETWEGRMEKFLNLGDAYTSTNTISGEKCYMVDELLYKDILLAVAARKQNERSLSTAASKLEQHIEEIGHSNDRIMKGEADLIEKMSRRMNSTFEQFREEHNTRMKNVMKDIREINASMVVSAEHGSVSGEMQRLRFQVERHEQILPLFQAQLKDTQDRNTRLWVELLEERAYIKKLKVRLEISEALAIKLGTADLGGKIGTAAEQEHKSNVI